MAESSQLHRADGWQIGPAIAAWLLPGLGHVWLGEKRRGLVIMAALVSLYLAGLLIGGIDVIDSREDRLWYYAQLFAGPTTIAVDYVHNELWRPRTERMVRSPSLGVVADPATLPYNASLGRVNELGTLYCALAGMLNLLVIIDLLYRPPGGSAPPPQPALRGRVVRRENSS